MFIILEKFCKEMYIKIALVGRPNVGKSTLFNKIIKKKNAIVFDQPGITRDRIEAVCEFFKLKLKLIDTAGFDNTRSDEISIEMVKQSIKAVEDAEVIVLIVDARESLQQLDFEFAKILRKFGKPIVLVCNKVENGVSFDAMPDINKLGFKNTVEMSAEHNIGFKELSQAISKSYEEAYSISIKDALELSDEGEEYVQKTKKVSIAIVGRPNAGKSTMFNKILGDYRSIVSEIAGTTRDSIHHSLKFGEYDINLTDTAGIRKRLKINDRIEEFSVESAFYSIKFSTVVILCMDCLSPFDSQDLKIAKFALDEGRGIVIILNKWDLISEVVRKKIVNDLDRFLGKVFPKAKGLPYFTISAKNDEKLDEIMEECITLHEIWSKRINTSKLNSFVRDIAEEKSPGKYKGHDVKIKFATQVNTRPPSFCIFTNHIDGIKESYKSYLENSIREQFGIFGVPIRINFKKSDNPFAEKFRENYGKNAKERTTKRFQKVLKKSQARFAKLKKS